MKSLDYEKQTEKIKIKQKWLLIITKALKMCFLSEYFLRNIILKLDFLQQLIFYIVALKIICKKKKKSFCSLLNHSKEKKMVMGKEVGGGRFILILSFV